MAEKESKKQQSAEKPTQPAPAPLAIPSPVPGRQKLRRPRGRPALGSDFASTQEELGRRVTPQRDRKIIQRALQIAGCPGKRADGSYHVPSWQAFLNSQFGSRAVAGQSEERVREELRTIRLRNERMELENQQRRGELAGIDEVVSNVTGAFGELLNQIRNLDDTLSTKLVGLNSTGTVKKRLKEERWRMLQAFASGDWAPKKKAFWRNVCAKLQDRLPKLLRGHGLNDG